MNIITIMYQGTNYPNCYRPYSPRNPHVRPQGHNFQSNISPYPSWQPRHTGNFQNVEYKYWCETCDKGFRFANHLENHKLQHQKCNIDGCQYVAHPKVITRHIQMQHSTDLFKKISKLNNPEEIQKWREERKRKYPTKENIEKKKAEINERIKRGEKMGMRREKGKNDNYNKGYTNKGKPHPIKPKCNNLKRKFTSGLPQRQEQDQKICKIVPPIDETRTLKPFAGIQDLIDDDSDEVTEDTCKTLIDDADDDFINKNDEIKEGNHEATICSALTSLLCEYGSSDEEEVQDNINWTSKETNNKSSAVANINAKNDAKQSLINNNSDTKSSVVEKNLSKIDTTKLNKVQLEQLVTDTEKNNESDNDSGPEETTIVKDEKSTANDSKTTNVPKAKKATIPKIQNTRHLNIIKRKRKLPSTLLEKLLHKEIQFERNIILQCIRHIVDNNFYDDNK